MRIELRRGELLAAVSGLALFACMLLPWYGTKHVVTETGFLLPARDVTINAWRSFAFIDVVLAAAAVVAVAGATLALVRRDAGMRAALSLITLAFGVLATALVLFRILVPLDSVEREIGLFLALGAAIGVAAGGFVWVQEEGSTVADARREVGQAIAGEGSARPHPRDLG